MTRDGDARAAAGATSPERRARTRARSPRRPQAALSRLRGRRARVNCARALALETEEAGDHHALHLVGAFADLEDLLVAVEPRDRVLVHEAVTAVDLQCGIRGAIREQAGIELGLCRRERERLAVVLEPGGAVDELAAGLDLRRHVRELELDCLKLRDRLAELPPFLRVREREIVRALREPDAHRSDRDASAVENLHELVEALAALTEQVALGHAAVLERQLARVGGVPEGN